MRHQREPSRAPLPAGSAWPAHYTSLALDRHGWLYDNPNVRILASPNQDNRPAQQAVCLLVIHNISLPPGDFGGPHVVDLFLNRLDTQSHPWFHRLEGLKVSAHFLVRRDGSILQFVSTDQRAWHAGVSTFEGRTRCNDFSIGIELEGTDDQAYEPNQYGALTQLSAVLRKRYPLRAVRGHEHIAAGRKTDPGPSFDWARFAKQAQWARRQLPA